MLPIRTMVRDIVSQRLWKISDALEEHKYAMWSKEEYVMRTILNALPTPSKAIRLARDVANNLAYSVCPNCETCNCWPCDCGRKKANEEWMAARTTWLDNMSLDEIEPLFRYVRPLASERQAFLEDMNHGSALRYRAAAYKSYESGEGITLAELKSVFEETEKAAYSSP